MQLRVLGSVSVEHDGDRTALGPQLRRLVAVLVIAQGKPVSVDRLVEVLWPDEEHADSGARSLRTYMSRLRSALPEAPLVAGPAGYALALPHSAVDASQFERLVDSAAHGPPDQVVSRYDEALALWRGEPFGELADEWWALAEADRLRELYRRARVGRAEAMLATGSGAAVVPDLRQAVAEDPLDERAVVLLMEALRLGGRRTEALRVAADFRRRLADTSGLDPTERFDAIETDILQGVTPASVVERPLRGYTLKELIGEGATGRVYAATQPGTERRVAIKSIRPDLADHDDFVARFEREARVLARLEHPHIVPLYDAWREPGAAYLVMRLLTGGTARDSVVTEGPWSVERVSRLVEEVGGALLAAHEVGVVHRDVKPSNVLLDDAGAAYLADFGIADEQAEAGDDVSGLASTARELLTGVTSVTGRITDGPAGLDALLRTATAGGIATVAEFVLAWRAAVGGAKGLTPLPTRDMYATTHRRSAARQLAEEVAAALNPYCGLRAFDEADEERFFGREVVVTELVACVERGKFVAIVGASGSGKSSVVRAGLMPRLRALGHTVISVVPGDDPMGALDVAVREVATAPDVAGTVEETIGRLRGRVGAVTVVIDQCEECWTAAPAERRDAFLGTLDRAISKTERDVRVVATIRADLLHYPLEDPVVGPRIRGSMYALPPMSPNELVDAITAPAARHGVVFDPVVTAELVSFAATSPGSLPLLQFTLAELYDARTDGTIDGAALDLTGGAAGSIGRRAEQVFLQLDGTAAAATRTLFERLVIAGDGSPDLRRRVTRTALSPRQLLAADAYVEARLLVADRDPATREPTIEVAHEALLESWGRLAHWIDEDRQWIGQLRHLADAARVWDRSGRADSEVYRGARLEAAIEAVAGGRAVNDVEGQFLDAGRRVRDQTIDDARRAATRLRRLVVGVAIIAVLAIVAASVAVVQRRAATTAAAETEMAEREAQVEALVGQADSLRATQRDLAALLAIEAFRLSDDPRTRSSLLTAVAGDDGYLDTHHLDETAGSGSPFDHPPGVGLSTSGERVFTLDEPNERVRAGIVLPDGVTSFVAGPDGRVHPYHLATGAIGPPLAAVSGSLEAIDGGLLSAGADGAVLAHVVFDDTTGAAIAGIYDVATGAPMVEPFEVGGYVVGAQLDRAGATLYVAILDSGAVRAFDTRTGSLIGEIEAAAPPDPRFGHGVGIAVIDDGTVVVGSSSGIIRTVRAGTADVVATVRVGANVSEQLRPAGDGTTVVGSGPAGVVRFSIGGRIAWQEVDQPESCWNLAVVPAADRVFCGDHFGRIDVRDLATGSVLSSLDGQHGNTGMLWPATDDTELVSFPNNEPIVARWRLDGSGPVTRLIAHGRTTGPISPDGSQMIARRPARDGRRLHLLRDWAYSRIDIASGDELESFGSKVPLTWMADGSILALFPTVDGGQLARYEPGTGETELGDLIVVDNRTYPPSVDPGKERVLAAGGTAGGGTVLRAIDGEGHFVGPAIEIDDYSASSISHRGDYVVAATSRGVDVLDRDGTTLGSIPGDDIRIAFVTVADQFFVATLGGELVHHDLETLEPIGTFGGSRGAVQELVGTADGSLIAVRGGDGRVSLYDVATETAVGAPFEMSADDQLAVALSLDGGTLAYGGGRDRPIRIVDLSPDAWIGAACRIAGRNLTEQEWNTYIGNLAEFGPTCPVG